MTVTLDSLEMGPQERQACQEAVQKLAYFKWLDAGCPEHGQVEFWLQAERDWIARCYVPPRTPAAAPASAAKSGSRASAAHKEKRSRETADSSSVCEAGEVAVS